MISRKVAFSALLVGVPFAIGIWARHSLKPVALPVPHPAPVATKLGPLPKECQPWKEAEPKPALNSSTQEDEHLACTETDCISKAQANAFRWKDGMVTCDDWDKSMKAPSVECRRKLYDDDHNQVSVERLSCPTTTYGDCRLIENRKEFVPHQAVTLGEVAKNLEELCMNQTHRAVLCRPWCEGGKNPECAPYWSVTDTCRDLAQTQLEIVEKGSEVVQYYTTPG
jgi:hypothetical protein